MKRSCGAPHHFEAPRRHPREPCRNPGRSRTRRARTSSQLASWGSAPGPSQRHRLGLPDGNLYALPPKETFRDDQMLEEDDRRGPRSTTHSATGRQKAALQRFPLSTPSTSLIDLSHIRSRFGLPTKRPKPLAKKRGQWLTMGTDMTMIEKVARAICKTHGAFDPDALTAGVAAWKYYIASSFPLSSGIWASLDARLK